MKAANRMTGQLQIDKIVLLVHFLTIASLLSKLKKKTMLKFLMEVMNSTAGQLKNDKLAMLDVVIISHLADCL